VGIRVTGDGQWLKSDYGPDISKTLFSRMYDQFNIRYEKLIGAYFTGEPF